MSSESGGSMENRLREAGLRVTVQRRAVWSAFERAHSGHLTAEEIFGLAREELPELARATVYNSLSELVRAGMLQVVEGRGALLYDRNLDPDHHHFRCRSCGGLYDVHVEGVEGLGVRDGEEFLIDQKHITLEGLCPRCAAG
ncbi:MAG: transcriptional repressor [Rubrobacter sp.]|nr:transcriptional repressor [Rubrobacter sp.]